MDAADHAAAGRGACHLLDLGLAVDRVERHPKREGRGDVALLLDGVSIGDAVGRGASLERGQRLVHRGDVEAAAQRGQELEDFRRRIGLHGVEDLAVRQRLGEGQIVLAHHVEVEDEAWPLFLAALQKLTDTCGHLSELPSPGWRREAASSEPPVMRAARG
jgi:hypothetical protein